MEDEAGNDTNTPIILEKTSTKKKGRPSGAFNFTEEELNDLLDCVDNILPNDGDMWRVVATVHARKYPNKRSAESLKGKFEKLCNQPRPAGRRAAQIRGKIGERKLSVPSEFNGNVNNTNNTPKKIGRPTGAFNFTEPELNHLLDCIDNILPSDADKWKAVATEHATKYRNKNRSADSLKVKFDKICCQSKSTGTAPPPRYALRAMQIKERIANREVIVHSVLNGNVSSLDEGNRSPEGSVSVKRRKTGDHFESLKSFGETIGATCKESAQILATAIDGLSKSISDKDVTVERMTRLEEKLEASVSQMSEMESMLGQMKSEIHKILEAVKPNE